MIGIDTSDLKLLAQHLSRVGRQVGISISPVLNQVGPEMRSKSVEMIVQSLDGRPSQGDVADAIHEKTASDLIPEYAEISDASRWHYVRWVTQADDRVCPICAPLHGAILRRSVAMSIEVHNGHVGDGHCRCSLEDIPIGEELLKTAPAVLPPAQEEAIKQVFEKFVSEFGL